MQCLLSLKTKPRNKLYIVKIFDLTIMLLKIMGKYGIIIKMEGEYYFRVR